MKKNKKKKRNAHITNEELWSLAAAGSAMLVGMAIRAALNKSWKVVTKNDPPLNPASGDTSWKEAIVWTVTTSVAVGLGQLLARKGTDTLWHQISGNKPGKGNATVGGL